MYTPGSSSGTGASASIALLKRCFYSPKISRRQRKRRERVSKQKTLGNGLEQRVPERARAKGLDARKQPLSGVLKTHPSDAVIEHTLVECKVRSAEIDAAGHRIIRVDIDWLLKNAAHAQREGFESAALVVNVKGSQKPHVLIDLDFFLDLLKSRKDYEQFVQDSDTRVADLEAYYERSLRELVGGKLMVVPDMPVLPLEVPGE